MTNYSVHLSDALWRARKSSTAEGPGKPWRRLGTGLETSGYSKAETKLDKAGDIRTGTPFARTLQNAVKGILWQGIGDESVVISI